MPRGRSSIKKIFNFKFHFSSFLILFIIASVFLLSSLFYSIYLSDQLANLLLGENERLYQQLIAVEKELYDLKQDDQYQVNQELKATIAKVEDSYDSAVASYERLLDLQAKSDDTNEIEALFADALSLLADLKYEEADERITEMNSLITKSEQEIAAKFTIPQNVATESAPPPSGYRRQQVATSIGNYLVSIVSADLNSTRVIVDTASDSTCTNDCPVLPLSTYVSRSGAYAGINGSYFCPESYPSCASKTNSFDTLLMNKNKTYFNSDNNVYSNVPAVIFSGNSARFVSASSQWGRDTSVDAVLANYPLLVLNGQIVFGGSEDPKIGSKGGRSFVGATGSTAYIGVVHNATVAESAIVLHALGIQNALNLDDGGSTALWAGGYKVGPGRNLPNVLLFMSK